jgi:hypothetical protein
VSFAISQCRSIAVLEGGGDDTQGRVFSCANSSAFDTRIQGTDVPKACRMSPPGYRILLACAGKRELHAGERAACSGSYQDTHALQHAVSSLGAARINPRGVGDSVRLRSARILLAS